MINVAMLSFWHVHAEGYAREVQESPLAQITAVWDEDPERGRAQAQKLGVPFHADMAQAMAGADAVVVTAPTNRHEEVILAAARAGKAIFTEKVLAPTLDEALRIAGGVEAAGVPFCISFPHRGFPANRFIKQVVDEGRIGRVTLARMRNAHAGSTDGWLPEHFYDPVTCGGGAMMDLGAHPMYLLGWLLGEPRRITSLFTSVTGHAVEDNAVSTIEFAGGAIGVSETGFVSKASPPILEVYGDQGTVMVCGPDSRVFLREKGEAAFRAVAGDELPEAAPKPIDMFLQALAGRGQIEYTLSDAVALTRLMDGAYRAYREGRVVDC